MIAASAIPAPCSPRSRACRRATWPKTAPIGAGRQVTTPSSAQHSATMASTFVRRAGGRSPDSGAGTVVTWGKDAAGLKPGRGRASMIQPMRIPATPTPRPPSPQGTQILSTRTNPYRDGPWAVEALAEAARGRERTVGPSRGGPAPLLQDAEDGLREPATLNRRGPEIIPVEPTLGLLERVQDFIKQLGWHSR